jgi:uncharacterized protein (TIGR02246 family)
MKRILSLCAISAIAITLTACNQAADTHDADVKAINDTETQWNRDLPTKDLDKLVSYYADDGSLILAGAPPSTGKDAIRAAFKGLLADPAASLQFHATRAEVAKSGDLGFTQGAYTLTVTDPVSKQPIHDHGTYVTVYRKQADGSWKAVSDVASSEVPPPAPAPAPEKKK